MATTPDSATQAWLDQEDRHTALMVRKHGTFIQYVYGEPRRQRTSFAYTVGLFGLSHPELLITGADTETAGNVLNDVSALIRKGHNVLPGELLTFDGWPHRVVVEIVPNPGEIAFAANRFYERPNEFSVPLLQLTYDDRWGRFPWDDGYDIPAWVQPRPGELSA